MNSLTLYTYDELNELSKNKACKHIQALESEFIDRYEELQHIRHLIEALLEKSKLQFYSNDINWSWDKEQEARPFFAMSVLSMTNEFFEENMSHVTKESWKKLGLLFGFGLEHHLYKKDSNKIYNISTDYRYVNDKKGMEFLFAES